MNHNYFKGIFILIVLFSTISCLTAPTESLVKTAIAETNAAIATSTSIPEPTLTFTKTQNPTSTFTSTPKPTATDTPTPTPVPPLTQTALARLEQKTKTAIARTSTADALSKMRTSTASAKSIKATEIASYTSVYWKDLITYPEKYKGQKIKISGQVFNVIGTEEVQMYVGSYDAIYVVMSKSFSDLYENSWIIVYGTGDGKYCFENAYGGNICQPILINSFYVFP